MKIAILSESSADEAAISILVSGILGREVEFVPAGKLRSRGWPAVLRVLPAVLNHLHYQTDADALVVIVDSDDSPAHNRAHEEIELDPLCRLCQLRSASEQTIACLSPRPQGQPIKVALGLAVPAIEAWYLAGVDQQVNEAAWIRKLQGQRVGYDRLALKRAMYGTDRPSLGLETTKAMEAAQRQADDVRTLERLFPNGFGTFAHDLRRW